MQIGNDIGVNKPIYLVGVGIDENEKERVIVQKVEYSNGNDSNDEIRISTIVDVSSNIF